MDVESTRSSPSGKTERIGPLCNEPTSVRRENGGEAETSSNERSAKVAKRLLPIDRVAPRTQRTLEFVGREAISVDCVGAEYS